MRRWICASLIGVATLWAIGASSAHAQSHEWDSSAAVGEFDGRTPVPNDGLPRDRLPEQRGAQDAAPYLTTRQSKRLSPPPAAAPGGEKSNKVKAAGSASSTVSALAIVIAVILVGGWILKRHNPLAIGGLPGEAVELLGRRQVDAKQAIHLVRLGSRLLVLGSSTQGLRTLAEVTDPVEVDYLAGLCKQKSSESSASQTFRALFNMRAATRRPPNRRGAGVRTPSEQPQWSAESGLESPEVEHV